METQFFNLEDICRFCAEKSDRLIGIYSEEGEKNDLPNKINLYLPEKVTQTNEYPLQCCLNCMSIITTWHDFVLITQETSKKLKFLLSSKDTESKIANDENNYEDESKESVETLNENCIEVYNIDEDQNEDDASTKDFFNCEHCDRSFKKEFNLDMHVLNKHPEAKSDVKLLQNRKHFCPICNQGFTAKQSLQVHVNQKRCNIVEEVEGDRNEIEKANVEEVAEISNENDIEIHDIDRDDDEENLSDCNLFVCEFCNRSFKKEFNLDLHMMKVHPEFKRDIKLLKNRKYFCLLCNQGFTAKTSLRVHIDEQRCYNSKKESPQEEKKPKKESAQVINDISEEYDVEVNDVDEDYNEESSSEFPFKCQYCYRCFKKDFNLDSHILKTHPYVKKKVKLLKKRKFFCPRCNQGFTTKYGMRLHVADARCKDLKNKLENKSSVENELIKNKLMDGCKSECSDENEVEISNIDDEENSNKIKPFACQFCNKSFKKEFNLENHIIQIHPNAKTNLKLIRYRNFFCSICKRGFTSRQSLKIHMNEKRCKNLKMKRKKFAPHFNCSFCDKRFLRRYNLENHVLQYHPEHKNSVELDKRRKYICLTCNLGFISATSLEMHQQSKRHYKVLQREIMNEKDAEPNDKPKIEPEIKQESVEKPNNIEVLELPDNKNTPEDDWSDFENKCNICKKVLSRKYDVIRHKRMVHQGLYSISNRKRDEVRELKERCSITLENHDRIMYKCDLCDFITTRGHYLKLHRSIHFADKPYICHICGKTFRLLNLLKRHLNEFHNRLKNYKCKVCNRGFKSKMNLEQHSNIHTNNRPYFCEICGKSFKQKASLYTHHLFHKKEYKFECTACEKKFIRSSELKNHMRKHLGIRPYVCDICNAAFTDSSNLGGHRRKVHSKKKLKQEVMDPTDLLNTELVEASASTQ